MNRTAAIAKARKILRVRNANRIRPHINIFGLNPPSEDFLGHVINIHIGKPPQKEKVDARN